MSEEGFFFYVFEMIIMVYVVFSFDQVGGGEFRGERD